MACRHEDGSYDRELWWGMPVERGGAPTKMGAGTGAMTYPGCSSDVWAIAVQEDGGVSGQAPHGGLLMAGCS